MPELAIHSTSIDGLLVIDLPVPTDARGWFKENWQRAKMVALGLPDFGPVQNNMSFNTAAGATRGLHAEPWDKLVSVATGRVYAAWADLRDGSATYGRVFSIEMGPDKAVFVPRGVANGYQALVDGTAYSYLVNEHWSPAARSSYTYVNLADPALGIAWPIPLEQAEISDADRHHPLLADVVPMKPKRTVIIGAGGQLGLELARQLPDAVAVPQSELDLNFPDQVAAYDWASVGVVLNAAAFTAVDLAETPQGRVDCWATNVTALHRLVEVCRRHHIKLVHVSSDYVFDGTRAPHTEDEPFSPLGVYGQTKAAGDALVATLPDYLITRASWVVGNGHNFVKTMVQLARRGVRPSVVDDQDGRLAFTADLAAAIIHLVRVGAPSGVYNVSNDGPVMSWCQIARRVFELCGRDASDVTPVSTSDYSANQEHVSPRPAHSALCLDKLKATGFAPAIMDDRLDEYVATLLAD
ncbi:MAG: bifunctional dTDP-4-dehydrorhamnose 3,5-epimerase family protein/NAD(P)-dependent oxidoreductase [Propionibacteriaceae bacterium]|nr:bifunctional dTDP-4-dehydrorhamnose 3,5-epimerase family protein/NAD(P)-dependent oxidoreductase [Propionibacteriaceae bacterium]